ncbi:hypothetical protein BHAOGJBA_4419 [Methylobacterium hispanicum]|uniref:Cobalamin biosynthesis protein CobT VWA domain-containing protein n=1 Tax=Methylobacterium hispanicum TaxID=270350 RepID=A0AAV4ZQM9_9HYPH|nr:cobalt chelatase [Methylobacterium hispanicum]GJD90876.1 hypothetical protein BHAOGJBA_4419 [Methylobacterium hispanicum]
MRRTRPGPAETRIFTREFDYVGSSTAILADPGFGPYAASLARRAELPQTCLEHPGRRSARLLDPEAVAGLPALVASDGRVVAILVDQSGGLRGPDSDRMVACVDRLALSLERAGVPFEVLAFSTLRWKGGLSREKWVAAGRPESPGRLNDLLHVVHKDLDEVWTEGDPSPRERLDLMMRDPFQREGLDGEALGWALDRLGGREQADRAVVVIGDATPIDDATCSVESPQFLEADLMRSVRRAARDCVSIETVGVRAEARIAEFYPKVTYQPPEGRPMDPVAACGAVLEALGVRPAPTASAAPRG